MRFIVGIMWGAETHRSNIMIKLNLHTTVELVLYAGRTEIIHVQLPAMVFQGSQNGSGRAEIHQVAN